MFAINHSLTRLYKMFNNLCIKILPSLFERNLKKCTKLRFLNTKLAALKVTPLTTKSIFDSQDIKAYNSVFPTLVDMMKKQARGLPEVTQRTEMIFKRLLPHEMLIEGLIVQALYKVMEPPEEQTPEKLFLSHILGWSYDFLVTSWQINDDIFEGTDIRWDYKCLYKQEDVKFQAVNDAVLLENLSYIILKEFCSNYPWYTSSLNMMHTVSVKTAFGQAMELMFLVDKRPKSEIFTFENFKKYNHYAGTYPAIMIPTMFATYCSGDYDDELFKKTQEVCDELALFKKIQDDMVDYKYDDISVGTLNWLVVQALAKASPGQKKLIDQHYGKSDPQSILHIQNLYEELDIYGLYGKKKNESADFVYQKTKNGNIKESHKRIFYKLIEVLYEIKINY